MEVGAPEEENALTETPITENEDSVPVKRSKASFFDEIDFGSAGQQTATNTDKAAVIWKVRVCVNSGIRSFIFSVTALFSFLKCFFLQFF